MSHAIAICEGSWVKDMSRKLKETPIGQSTPITLGIVAVVLAGLVGGAFQAGQLAKSVETLGTRVSILETLQQNDAANRTALNINLGKIQGSIEDIKARLDRMDRPRP